MQRREINIWFILTFIDHKVITLKYIFIHINKVFMQKKTLNIKYLCHYIQIKLSFTIIIIFM